MRAEITNKEQIEEEGMEEALQTTKKCVADVTYALLAQPIIDITNLLLLFFFAIQFLYACFREVKEDPEVKMDFKTKMGESQCTSLHRQHFFLRRTLFQ